MPSNLLKCSVRQRSLNAAFWETSQEFVASPGCSWKYNLHLEPCEFVWLKLLSMLHWRGSSTVLVSLRSDGILVGGGHASTARSCLGPLPVPAESGLADGWSSELQIWTVLKVMMGMRGIVTMGFNYNIWIGLLTYTLYLQTPHSPRGKWGVVCDLCNTSHRADVYLCASEWQINIFVLLAQV